MPELSRVALLPFAQERVYALVNDVERYPEFVPGCQAVEVLSREAGVIVATVHARAKGISESFTTRNLLLPPERIELALENGPFRTLSGAWHITALGAEGCKVALHLDYELAGLLGRTLKPLMSKAADTVVDAFVARARSELA